MIKLARVSRVAGHSGLSKSDAAKAVDGVIPNCSARFLMW